LSFLDESRMNDINDKMCLFHLEYPFVKTAFNKKKHLFTDFYIAEAKVATRISHSFSFSRQL